MPYSDKSPKLNIPTPMLGDLVDSSEQRRIAQIIENVAAGALTLHNQGQGVFKEGSFTGTFGSPDSTVTLSPTSSISFEGLINSTYVKSNQAFQWGGIPTFTTVSLYLVLVEGGSRSSVLNGDLDAIQVVFGPAPANSILVATATTTGASITVNTTPSGKKSITTLDTHIQTSTNPHGPVLHQDSIVVSGITTNTLRFREIVADKVTVNVANFPPIGALHVRDSFIVTKSVFLGNVTVASGATVDGVDPSAVTFLVDGSNGDFDVARGTGHRHDQTTFNSGIPVRNLSFAVDYPNLVTSGLDSAFNLTKTHNTQSGINVITNTLTPFGGENATYYALQLPILENFVTWSGIDIRHRESGGMRLNVAMKDSNNNAVTVTPNSSVQTPFVFQTFNIGSGTFTKGRFATLLLTHRAASSGVGLLAEIRAAYKTVS